MPTTNGGARSPVAQVRAAVAHGVAGVLPGVVGVGCSGGADSLALADAMIDELGAPNVVVLAIDHGLAADTARVCADVVTWARGRGAAALVRQVAVDAEASLEAAARRARYAAFDALAAELGLVAIALAHTARDQAETVLMRLVRGTGPAGLAAMAPVRGIYLRPLLGLPRAVIDDYVVARALAPWADPMNADPRFQRTRVREALLPALRRENPAIDDALCRLATSAREWTLVIDAAAAPFTTFPIDRDQLAAQPAAVRKRALALAIERAGGGYSTEQLDRVDGAIAATAPRYPRVIEVHRLALRIDKRAIAIAARGAPRSAGRISRVYGFASGRKGPTLEG